MPKRPWHSRKRLRTVPCWSAAATGRPRCRSATRASQTRPGNRAFAFAGPTRFSRRNRFRLPKRFRSTAARSSGSETVFTRNSPDGSGFDAKAIDDLLHAFGFAGKTHGPIALVIRVDASAQRDRRPVGCYVDRPRFDEVIERHLRRDLRGHRGIADRFAGPCRCYGGALAQFGGALTRRVGVDAGRSDR